MRILYIYVCEGCLAVTRIQGRQSTKKWNSITAKSCNPSKTASQELTASGVAHLFLSMWIKHLMRCMMRLRRGMFTYNWFRSTDIICSCQEWLLFTDSKAGYCWWLPRAGCRLSNLPPYKNSLCPLLVHSLYFINCNCLQGVMLTSVGLLLQYNHI